jgi:hypothetical protein
MNTPVWTQIVTLSRPCRDRSVGLAGRQCHCVMTRNVCLSAVCESPNLVYERQIKDTNLYCTEVQVVQKSNVQKSRTACI